LNYSPISVYLIYHKKEGLTTLGRQAVASQEQISYNRKENIE